MNRLSHDRMGYSKEYSRPVASCFEKQKTMLGSLCALMLQVVTMVTKVRLGLCSVCVCVGVGGGESHHQNGAMVNCAVILDTLCTVTE